MAKQFYVVYSVQTKLGSAFGRNTITCDREIDTIERVKDVESVLLKDLQEENPSIGYSNLFLISWRELSPSRT